MTPGALGGFVGGLVMSRLKLKTTGAIKLIILSTCAFIVGNAILLFLHCPQIDMAGQLDPDDGRYFEVFRRRPLFAN